VEWSFAWPKSTRTVLQIAGAKQMWRAFVRRKIRCRTSWDRARLAPRISADGSFAGPFIPMMTPAAAARENIIRTLFCQTTAIHFQVPLLSPWTRRIGPGGLLVRRDLND